ncbi:PIG-L deacetylase family protein [Lentisalinibacter sediminis]|uniref:PIG-L deacetylase family protein n=1 Tax=Lentisalinibacter sediminis TaxID=2992237 RepID=UPI003863C2D1
MTPLRLDLGDAPTILCLGAHSDDIEIGAGGAILSLAVRYPGATIHWVVFSGMGERGAEARASAEFFTAEFANRNIGIFQYRDGFFPGEFTGLKETFQTIREACDPDLVFTHYREDLHQDHRMVSDLTWQTFRDHLILEYEIPKYDGDLGRPNLYFPLEEAVCEKKLSGIEKFFGSQREKRWFNRETFASIARMRGVECACVGSAAEAFFSRKARIQ